MNKKKTTKQPALRFPEFKKEGDWDPEQIETILDYERPDKYTVSNTNYKKEGIPVLTANKSFILGYTDDKEGIYQNLPAIIFDDFTTAKKFVDFLFKVKSSGIKILTIKEGREDNLKFMYELMMQLNFDARQHKRHYISVYQKLKPLIPTPKEQQKIAACFSSLDRLIDLEEEKLVALKAHKKGLLQKLFPKKEKTVPEYRFPEFEEDGEWEKKKLGEVAELFKGKGISKKHIVENGATSCIRYAELYTDYEEVIKVIKSSTNISRSKLILSKANDVIIPSSGETKEDIATAACVTIDGVALGGDLNVIRSDMDGKFLAYYLTHSKRSEIAKISQGYSVVHLYIRQLNGLKINLPKKAEQQKIAQALSSVDQLITAQSKKIKGLKCHKKGLMQQLFPKL